MSLWLTSSGIRELVNLGFLLHKFVVDAARIPISPPRTQKAWTDFLSTDELAQGLDSPSLFEKSGHLYLAACLYLPCYSVQPLFVVTWLVSLCCFVASSYHLIDSKIDLGCRWGFIFFPLHMSIIHCAFLDNILRGCIVNIYAIFFWRVRLF